MINELGKKSLPQLLDAISDQHRPVSGVVLAISAAQAVALSESCMQISLENQIDRLNWQETTTQIGRITHLKTELVALAAEVLETTTPAGIDEQIPVTGWLLQTASLSLEALEITAAFQPMILRRVAADWDVACTLLATTGRNALSLISARLPDALTGLSVEERAQLTQLTNEFARHQSAVNLP